MQWGHKQTPERSWLTENIDLHHAFHSHNGFLPPQMGTVLSAPAICKKVSVAILIHKSININHQNCDLEGRWLNISLTIDGPDVHLLNTYSPKMLSSQFWERNGSTNCIHPMLGTLFNLPIDCDLDRSSNSRYSPFPAHKILYSLLRDRVVVDPWRMQHPV